MAKKNKFSFAGVLILIAFVFVVCFFVVSVYIYEDLKNVEYSVHNLYNQVRTQNVKIDKFGVADENLAQQSMKFSEATKNWQNYQNGEFGFQLKNPVSWGNVETVILKEDGLNYFGRQLQGEFNKFSDGYLNFEAASYDFIDESNKSLDKFATESLYDEILISKPGECSHDVFEILKKFGLGEVRNCYIRDNILKQKFVVYRYVMMSEGSLINSLVAVYPRKDFYLKVNLPEDVLDEVDYFIQSIIFMQ